MRLFPLIMLIFSFLAPAFADSAESNRFVSHEDTVSLVSETDSGNGSTLRLGLLFRLSNGWHIYWKDPGDAGSPPQLTLTTPGHTTISGFDWPAPDWLLTNSLGDYVVSGTVLLPFSVALPQPVSRSGANVRDVAHWLVCSAVSASRSRRRSRCICLRGVRDPLPQPRSLRQLAPPSPRPRLSRRG